MNARSQNGLAVVPEPGFCGVVFSPPKPDVGAQRAVFGLLADVPRDHPADAVVDVVGVDAVEAGLTNHAAGAVAGDDAAAAHVVLGLDS